MRIKYALYAEVHTIKHLVQCEYNGKVRYIDNENELTTDELMFGEFKIIRDSFFDHYRLLRDDIIKDEKYEINIADEIRADGLICPIARIDGNKLYSSCIYSIDIQYSNEDFNRASELLDKIQARQEMTIRPLVEEADFVEDKPEYNYQGPIIYNKKQPWYKRIANKFIGRTK